MTETETETPPRLHDVVVIGAGAAGIGVAITLGHAEVPDVVLLDRNNVASSFDAWPAETRFITPSFPTNSVGMLDLNAVAIGTSPAITTGSEHPTGGEYASYLRRLAEFFELLVVHETDVTSVTKIDDEFHLDTSRGWLRTKHVVWAAGEFQYPRLQGISGADHCRHTATVDRYADLDGDDIIIIGGYESGVDAAYHLAGQGKRVRLFDSGCPWKDTSSDPSIALSTYSHERMQHPHFVERVELHPDTAIASVTHEDGTYRVTSAHGRTFETTAQPLYAGGFEGGHSLVAHLFEEREDGYPLLSEDDESTITPGLFLCGPAVRHGTQSFCFIYKYRQRFAVVAKAIATSLGLEAEQLEAYRMWGMYLDDLSVCGEDCVC
ncbi:MAG: NAD(P)/FAD-dependent oxidoreductase [Actinomycetota bacterium]